MGYDASARARVVGPSGDYHDSCRWATVAFVDDRNIVYHGGMCKPLSLSHAIGNDIGASSGTYLMNFGTFLGTLGIPARVASALGGGEQQALRGRRLCECRFHLRDFRALRSA